MYNLNYFINKFEAIPEDRWCVFAQSENGNHCAYGWCMTPYELQNGNGANGHQTPEGKALSVLFLNAGIIHFGIQSGVGPVAGVACVNNGVHPNYKQPTPKQRILAALYDIKQGQALTEAQNIISSPSIPQPCL